MRSWFWNITVDWFYCLFFCLTEKVICTFNSSDWKKIPTRKGSCHHSCCFSHTKCESVTEYCGWTEKCTEWTTDHYFWVGTATVIVLIQVKIHLLVLVPISLLKIDFFVWCRLFFFCLFQPLYYFQLTGLNISKTFWFLNDLFFSRRRARPSYPWDIANITFVSFSHCMMLGNHTLSDYLLQPQAFLITISRTESLFCKSIYTFGS